MDAVGDNGELSSGDGEDGDPGSDPSLEFLGSGHKLFLSVSVSFWLAGLESDLRSIFCLSELAGGWK